MNGFAGLRIGLVGPLPPHAGSGSAAGGMANQTRQLAELLVGEGALVATVQTNASFRPAWVGGLPVVRAALRLVPYLLALWRAAGRSDVFHVMANSGWAWHLFAVPAIWIAWLRRVPVVVNYRGGEAASFLVRSSWQVRWSMQRVARLVVPSAFLQAIFREHGMAAQVLPNIVDLARFRERSDATTRSGAHLVVARNLEPIYDNATALRAFALVHNERSDARLTIAGSGPEEPRLRALASHLGVTGAVRFGGALDRDAMAGLYREADVCVNASLADNTPNSLLEAMASGVAIVSTNVGGVPYLVAHATTALLVPPQDPQSMAQAVLRLLDDAPLRARLVSAGLQQAQRYSWPQVAPLLAATYRSVVVAAPATPARA